MTAGEAARRYRQRSLSPVEAAAAQLERLETVEPKLNAFMARDGDMAMAQARASEARWAKGAPLGPLDGVTVTVKDLIPMRGLALRHGSASSDGAPCGQDAPSVARLREAGCVFLGKTTTPEFGWKGITDGPLFGFTRNPWNLALTPGGSSGGAAAALAAGIGHLALGNDGGGSIRIPAAWCGLYGLKPSFGRVPDRPREGLFCTASTEGPLARRVADAAAMLNALACPDAGDSYALPPDGRDWQGALPGGVAGLKIAYLPGLAGASPCGEVRAAVERGLGLLAELGAAVEEVGAGGLPLASLEQGLAPLWLAGFAALLRAVAEERRRLLDPRFRALAERGQAVTVAELQAATVQRDRLGVAFNRFHQQWDLLATPTMALAAPAADTPYHGATLHRWRDATPYTLPFNLTGQPAASLPCGLTASGLPVGLQLVAARHRDDLVLRASRAFERALPPAWPDARLEAALAAAPPPLAQRYGEPLA